MEDVAWIVRKMFRNIIQSMLVIQLHKNETERVRRGENVDDDADDYSNDADVRDGINDDDDIDDVGR